MRLYKSTLTLNAAFATMWHADTFFGHLCWSVLRSRGEAALTEFLTLYENGSPPILISDGFPGDYLPRPLLPSVTPGPADLPKAERLKRQRTSREATRVSWLTLAEFNKVRLGEIIAPSLTEDALSTVSRIRVIPKNQIDRVTNTTSRGEGNLYDMEEFVLPRVTMFWRIKDGYFDIVNEFLIDLKVTGYGKRKSVGYGQIESIDMAPFDGFTDVPYANGFVSLSRFVPAVKDPTDGFWNVTVKYGKLGEEFATSGNPFKRPLIQLSYGSCFRDAQVREWYGQLIGGLSARPEVKQYGFAFPVGMCLPDLGELR